MSSTLVRVVFALLVVATAGAFVATQLLKGEFPLVLRFAASPNPISPNGDRVRDGTTLGFDLSEPAEVSFAVVDRDGNEVRRIVDDRRLAGDAKHRFFWNGRDEAGTLVPDGVYRMRVVQRREGRTINSIKSIKVDTRRPRAVLTSARPGVIAPGEPGQRPRVVLRYRGPKNEAPEFRVFRTDDGPPRVVFRFRGNDRRTAVWDGRVRGRPAVEGNYAFSVTVRDRAGNVARSPAPELPTPASARAGTGVAVRPLALRGPLTVVPAGSLVRLRVGPFERSFDFALSRLGSPRTLRRGERIGGSFRVRVPRRSRTGLYVVRVRAGKRRAVWPLAVAGLPPRRAAGRPRPLVVLPAITWQGLNRTDDDLDGFADTLVRSRSVALERPFRGGRLPALVRREALPLLRFLERERLPYDLTTDVSLERGEGPALGNAPGVALAGSARWVTGSLERRLRAYVRDGGQVALLGATPRGRVRLARGRLTGPSTRAADVFGERTSPLRTSSAPLAVERRGLGLFRRVDGFFGDFSVFELSRGLPQGARLAASAGRDRGEPAFVAYRLGRGTVIRTGSPQWNRELDERRLDLEVPRVTRSIWRLLR